MAKPGPVPAPPEIKRLRKTAPSRMPAARASASGAPKALLPAKPPKHLRDEAAECWTAIASIQRDMAAGGGSAFIGETERQLVEVACVSYRQWRHAVRMFDFALAKAKESGDPDTAELRTYLTTRRKGDETELGVSALQNLVVQTSKEMRSSFRALGLPRQTPSLVAQIAAESASGDKMAMELLA